MVDINLIYLAPDHNGGITQIMKPYQLVTVRKDPRYRNLQLKSIGGFISQLGEQSAEVCLLDEDGKLTGCLDIAIDDLTTDVPNQLHYSFEKYQNTLNEIEAECAERGKQYKLTQQALAKKYSLSEDEVYAIYKGMLNFEDYYAEFLT